MKGFSLEHLLRPAMIEQENGKSPAVFMLHGYGSNKDDLFSFASELPEKYAVISVQAPYSLSDTEYAWYSMELDATRWSDIVQAYTTQRKLLIFIEQSCQKYSLDEQQITLLGFNQGCILSLSMALSFPKKIQKVIGISGFIDTKILADNYQKNDFSGLSIFLAHGISDQIIPVQWAEEAVTFLKELNIDCTYEKFSTGHNITPKIFYSFKEWLNKH